MSSFSALLVSVACARTLPVAEFGFFSLLYLTQTFTIGAVRSLYLDSQLATFLRVGASDSRRSAAAARLWAGIAVVTLVIVVPLFLAGREWALVVAAQFASLAALGVVDAARQFFLLERAPGRSVTLMAILLCLNLAAVIVVAPDTTVSALGVLAGSASVVGVPTLLWFAARGHLAPGGPRTVLGKHGWRYLAEYMSGQGGYFAALWIAAALAGPVASAGLRLSELVLGPLRILVNSLPAAMVSQASTTVRRSWTVRVSGGLAVLAALYVLAGTLVAVRLPSSVLGPSTDVFAAILPIYGVSVVFSTVSIGAVIGLRSLTASRESMQVRVISGILMCGTVAVGAVVGGRLGAASGFAIASATACVLWWRTWLAVSADGSGRVTTLADSDGGEK